MLDIATNWHLNALFFGKSNNWNLNGIFYWKLSQLILGVIIVDKLENPFWGVFSRFYSRVPTPNEQPFLHFIIFLRYFVRFYHCLPFYIFFYCSYLYVSIFDGVMNFEFNLFPKGEYFKILV